MSRIAKAVLARKLLINLLWREGKFRMWNLDDLLGLTKRNVKKYIDDHFDLMENNSLYAEAYEFALVSAYKAGISKTLPLSLRDKDAH